MGAAAKAAGETPDDGKKDQGADYDSNDCGPLAIGLLHTFVPTGERFRSRRHVADKVSGIDVVRHLWDRELRINSRLWSMKRVRVKTKSSSHKERQTKAACVGCRRPAGGWRWLGRWSPRQGRPAERE